MFNSLFSPLNSTVLPLFLLPLEWSSLWGRCAAYFSEYSLRTFHFAIECPGPCTENVFRQSFDLSYGLHGFSCYFQSGPSWCLLDSLLLVPYIYFHEWHVSIIPWWLFYKVLLLHIIPPQSPCVQTCHIYHFMTYPQIPSPVDRFSFLAR